MRYLNNEKSGHRDGSGQPIEMIRSGGLHSGEV